MTMRTCNPIPCARITSRRIPPSLSGGIFCSLLRSGRVCALIRRVKARGGGANAALTRTLGALRVADYASTDVAAQGVRYDLMADAVGSAQYARVRDALMRSRKLLPVPRHRLYFARLRLGLRCSIMWWRGDSLSGWRILTPWLRWRMRGAG